MAQEKKRKSGKTAVEGCLVPSGAGTEAYSAAYRKADTSKQKLSIVRAWRDSYPEDVTAWFLSGELEKETGNIEQALRSYSTALRLSPHDLSTLGRLGDLYFETGEYVHSFSYYSRLLEIDGPPVWGLIGAGNLFERLGITELTLLLFLQALEQDAAGHPSLYQRVLNLFDSTSSETKKRYADAISRLIDQMPQALSLDSADIKRLSRMRKLCRALCASETAKPEPVESYTPQIRQLNLKKTWELWRERVENYLLSGLEIRIEGINRGKLQARIVGVHDERVVADLWVDGRMYAKLNFVPQNGQKNSSKSLSVDYILPPDLLDARPHVYFIKLQIGNFHFQSHPEVLSRPEYAAQLDDVRNGVLLGWALVKDDLSVPSLRVTYEDGSPAMVQADIQRLDVSDAFPGAPSHTGFSIALPPVPPEGLTLQITDATTNICLVRAHVASPYDLMSQVVHEWSVAKKGLYQRLLKTVATDMLNRSRSHISVVSEFLPLTPRSETSGEIAIIIPVYEGLESTIDCIESVLSTPNINGHKLIIIDDCSPNPGIQAYLRDLDQQRLPHVLIVKRKHSGGFSESVNLGILMAGARDVILLNSDTIVQNNWFDRLRYAALSEPDIATATPLSNNGEICNVPYISQPTIVSDAEIALRIDRVASKVSAQQVVDIPVAVGFCVYIKRACLDDIGLFDSATWGRGYGEEVDFCLKARGRGWRHVLALDTFVAHRGAVSFGAEKAARIQESSKRINAKYPFYDELIQRFISENPARKAGRTLNLRLLAEELPARRILHVTHRYLGGTEQYLRDQCELARIDGSVPLVLRVGDAGEAQLECELKTSTLEGFFADKHTEEYRHDEFDEIRNDIVELKIERVHLHAPFGMPINFLRWLVDTYPTTVTIHDYAWICPRVTLSHENGQYCGEPDVASCNRCISVQGIHKGLRHFVEQAKEDVTLYREAFQEILTRAELVLAGAQDVVSRLRAHGIDARYQVTPHPHSPTSVFLRQGQHRYPLREGEPIKVAVIGAITPGKGLVQLAKCAAYAAENRIDINFIVFGNTSDDDLLRKFPNVTILGAYAEDKLEELIACHKPHIALFPYQWPETYSYTLSHAIRLNMRIVVTNIGAMPERIKHLPDSSVVSVSAEAQEMVQHIVRAVKGTRRTSRHFETNHYNGAE
jgi:GT2 family glycosyltransferase/glycosyltransferase involved in cell wall biosynthesis